jgi:phage terminase large subunit GpA-like protein
MTAPAATAIGNLRGRQEARQRERRVRARVFQPKPRLTVAEWSDRHRVLTREASAEAGQWRTDRAPYQRAIMEALSDPSVEKVVWMKSSQVGATEILVNYVGYIIAHDPGHIPIVQPTEQMAKAVSMDRITPMTKTSPAVRERVHRQTGGRRDAGDTMLYKTFAGGHLTLTTARSAASLASRPIRYVLLDEVDRYPPSAGDEGRPTKLAERRTATFWNRKIYIPSTPTVAGKSQIESEYERTDQRRYFVACPHCGHRQHLRWAQVRWDKETRPDGTHVHHPATAAYCCEDCAALIEEADKPRLLADGEWQPTNPEHRDPRVVGFHINALYSPWMSWAQVVQEFLDAKGDQVTLRTFVNTLLGETFEEELREYDAADLRSRCEPYGAEVPREVAVLTAFADVQGDRLEVSVIGWGPLEESWLIRHEVLLGDPGGRAVWEDLDRVLAKAWSYEGGGVLRIRAAGIDSGGHHTDAVYAYVRARRGRKLHACKGHSQMGQPIWPERPPKAGKGGVKVYLIGTDTAKDRLLLTRLRKLNADGKPEGAGAMHFPEGTSEEYFAALTAEVKKPVVKNGRRVLRWTPVRERNEALDCAVGCMAMLRSLGRTVYEHLDRERDRVWAQADRSAPVEEVVPVEPLSPIVQAVRERIQSKPRRGKGRGGGWVQGWR